MKGLTDVFAFAPSAYQDERTRLNLIPQRVVLTRGDVSGQEGLLSDHPEQAYLGSTGTCRMENGAGRENAAVLLDFGRELHGTVKLTVSTIESENARAKVLVRYGESVMEAITPLGCKNTTNDHAVRDHIYDLGQFGTVETSEAGFRFVYLELQDEKAALNLQTVHLCFIYRDAPYIGSFSCNDPLLEKIFDTAAYTVHLNMQNYLWDGIKRDRLAWQGDMHTEVMTIENIFGADPVVPKTLDFLRDRTPEDEWINGYSSYSLWWVIIQAEWYRYTGDLAYLKEQRSFLKAQLALAASCVAEDGSETLPEFRFLDWKNLENKPATHAGLQALMKLAMEEGAWLAELLGEDALAAACRESAAKLAGNVPDHCGSKQAAAMLALAGLADPSEMNEKVIAPGGASDYSTFMGYYLMAAKAEAGDFSGALNDMRAYWGGMLEMGATTFWEDFDLSWMENAGRIDEPVPEGKKDIHGDYGAFCYEKFRHSLCHGWSSGPVPFIMRHIMGITVTEPGCKKLKVTPHLGGLRFAEADYPTPFGTVHVRHEAVEDGTVRTSVEAPEEVEVLL